MLRFLACLLAAVMAVPAFAQSAITPSVVQTDNVRAELMADVSAVKAGEPFWLGLRQTIRPKWHTYWKNPGESGLPTEITWTLPPGAKADPIVWPTPILFEIGGIINYGFKDESMLLVRITPPADLAGPLKLRSRRQLAGLRGRLHSRRGQVRADLAVGHRGNSGAAGHAHPVRAGTPQYPDREPVAGALWRRPVRRSDPDRRCRRA